MPLLLPNLDDRQWAELVAESTALIPVYGPQWTDQNYSDPGITIVELLAWITEMDIFHLSQITDAHRLKFLALVGIAPRPPLPAHAVLSFTLAGATAPTLPAGLEFSGNDPSGNAVRFRILREITLAPGSLAALQYKDTSGFHNLTPAWLRGRTMNPFGMTPLPGAEFYMGFSTAFPLRQAVQIVLTFGDGHSSWEDRCRLLREAERLKKLCQPQRVESPCLPKFSGGVSPAAEAVCDEPAPQHYGVRTVWEYLTTSAGQPTWVALDPWKKQVVDDTRAFTLDGTVTFRVPGTMTATVIGAVVAQYFYVRCRFEAGSYDAAPLLLSPAFNGVASVQAVPAAMFFPISIGATVTYASGLAPNPGDLASLALTLDPLGNITQLAIEATATGAPQFDIMNFQTPTANAAGLLCTNGVFLGFGDGTPSQQFTAPNAPVEPGSFRLYSLENRVWHEWQLRSDFDASTRKDWHAVLEATPGTLAFGNGENGRVPPSGAEIFAFYLTTIAADGNLAAQTINALADSPRNRAALYNPAAVPDGWTQLQGELGRITNPLAAAGGTAAETVSLAAGRADQLVETNGRAVTLADYERLAMQTPGTRIARAAAIANFHPSFPCCFAPGIITVIVLPYLAQGSPTPTPGLLGAVSAYLEPRRVIGTRVEVVGPTYLELAVQATVQSKTGTNPTNLQPAIVKALNNFLDPLVGGPDGTGWPFGRDVYRSEIMKVIDAVVGVDYIVSMALLADGGQAQCGNVCLSPTWLVQAGAHQITAQ
jgi:Baseplate J-like protein